MRDIQVSIVVARARNGVIGAAGGLPWTLRDDLAHFKSLTMGAPIIMGRHTWESLPNQPLAGRENIVMTRNWTYAAEGARVYSSLTPALQAARAIARRQDGAEVFVIGGAHVYKAALRVADCIYLTEVDAAPEGDVMMPAFDETAFAEVERHEFAASERNDHAFSIRKLLRRDAS
jgi:dihydrofolate reductase